MTASLRATLALGGCVALLAGLHSLFAGGRAIPGHRRQAHPAIESELRFYSAFYTAYGAALLASAARSEQQPATVPVLTAPPFLAGLGRVAAWRSVGSPNGWQQMLLAIELAGPPAILIWERRGRRPSGLD